jgi:hypothetical protein
LAAGHVAGHIGQPPGRGPRRPPQPLKARIAELIPPDIAEQIPLDLLGLITGLPAERRGFLGMALKSGLSSIKRMPRAMRRC